MKFKRASHLVLGLALLAANAPSQSQTAARTVDVHARRFEFIPAEVTMRKGETIQLNLISDDVPHSLLINGLHINQVVTKSAPARVVITPTETGDFNGQCGRFCGSGHGTMKFTIHVTGN